MKIFFVARNIPVPGHRENDIILRLAKELKNHGQDVSVLYPAEWIPFPAYFLSDLKFAIKRLGQKFNVDGITVTVLRYIRMPTLAFSYVFSYWFRSCEINTGADVVHAHYVMPDGWMGLRLSEVSQCPLVVTVRQGDLNKMKVLARWSPVGVLYRHVLNRADLILSPSASIAKELADYGYSAKVLPHGVADAEIYTSKPQDHSVVKVLVVASLIPRKRVDWVVNALVDYPGGKRCALEVLGSGEGDVELRQAALQGGLDAVFFGHVDRDVVFDRMSKADIFALPSVDETFGLVYLEAALRECAVVATKGTGVDGCFEEGIEAAFTHKTYEDFCKILWRLIDDQEARMAMAKKARLRVRGSYLWGEVVDKYLRAVQEKGKI